MIIKIIWLLLSIDAIMFLILLFMAITTQSDVLGNQMAWIMAVLAGIALLVAALPILISHRPISVVLSGIFSALPVLGLLLLYLSNFFPSQPQQMVTQAMYNFSNGKQRAIAQAIEDNNPTLLQELVKGQDLNGRGKEGRTYLQFAILLVNVGTAEAHVRESIRILIKAGADPDLAIIEAVDQLSPSTLALFLDGGANPNTEVEVHQALIFRAFNSGRPQNAELLLEKGANPNVLDEAGYSPAMRAALGKYWATLRFLLEAADADHTHTAPDGKSLLTIVQGVQQTAVGADANNTQSPDFLAVCAWLEAKNANLSVGK